MGTLRKSRRGCEEPVLAGSLQTLPVYSPKLGWGQGRGREGKTVGRVLTSQGISQAGDGDGTAPPTQNTIA